MTWKDKLELGLKEDAPFRKDNLPPSQVRGEEKPAGPGRSPEIPAARNDQDEVVPPSTTPAEPDGESKPLRQGPPAGDGGLRD